MKKVVTIFGLLAISFTMSSPALASQSSDSVSKKALGVLIKSSRSVKLVGDVRDDGSEKLYDIISTVLLNSGISTTNSCKQETDENLRCLLMMTHEYRGEQAFDYRVKIEKDASGEIKVLGLDSRTVQVSRGH